jgi:hypothetical protein
LDYADPAAVSVITALSLSVDARLASAPFQEGDCLQGCDDDDYADERAQFGHLTKEDIAARRCKDD